MEELVTKTLEDLARNVTYHKEGLEKEVKQNADKNKWLDDLYTSLGIEE